MILGGGGLDISICLCLCFFRAGSGLRRVLRVRGQEHVPPVLRPEDLEVGGLVPVRTRCRPELQGGEAHEDVAMCELDKAPWA